MFTRPQNPARRGPVPGAARAVPLLLVLLAAGLAGCTDEGAPDDGTSPTTTATPTTTTADPLIDPAAFVDRTVTVTGTVDDVLAPFAFTLVPAGTGPTATDGTAMTDGGIPGLLVIHDTGAVDADEGATLTVTGTVRPGIDLSRLEENLGITVPERLLPSFRVAYYLAVEDTTTSTTSTTTT